MSAEVQLPRDVRALIRPNVTRAREQWTVNEESLLREWAEWVAERELTDAVAKRDIVAIKAAGTLLAGAVAARVEQGALCTDGAHGAILAGVDKLESFEKCTSALDSQVPLNRVRAGWASEQAAVSTLRGTMLARDARGIQEASAALADAVTLRDEAMDTLARDAAAATPPQLGRKRAPSGGRHEATCVMPKYAQPFHGPVLEKALEEWAVNAEGLTEQWAQQRMESSKKITGGETVRGRFWEPCPFEGCPVQAPECLPPSPAQRRGLPRWASTPGGLPIDSSPKLLQIIQCPHGHGICRLLPAGDIRRHCDECARPCAGMCFTCPRCHHQPPCRRFCSYDVCGRCAELLVARRQVAQPPVAGGFGPAACGPRSATHG